MATTRRVDEETNLSDLHAQQNSSLPIFWLPPETLEHIFIYAARDYHEGDDRPNFRVPLWVNVSYVCSHWRNVALSCPTLWTYHFTISLRWTEELLARSKHASLKIRIIHEYSRTTPWWSRLVENVLSHAERIQELRLIVPRHIFPTELSLNAPRLQILDIDFLPHPPERTLIINNGDTLPLRILKLTECPLPWHSSFNLSGITTLSLCLLPSSSQQDIPDFLDTLSGMQALTVLHLEDALPSAHAFLSSGAFAVSPKVTLPCLISLFVGARLSTVIALFSCMGIPLKTQVRIDIEPEFNSSIDKYARLSSLLAQRFSHFGDLSSPMPEIRSLSICFSYDSDFTLIASERHDCDPDLSKFHQPADCRIPLLIRVNTLTSWISRNDRVKIMGNFCCAIPSTHVQTLRITKPPVSSQFWNKTLGHLGGLRHMKLSKGYMPDLASLLTLEPGCCKGRTLAPELKALELFEIEFDSSGSLDDVISEQSLLDALSTREALQLTMTGCSARGDMDAITHRRIGSDY